MMTLTYFRTYAQALPTVEAVAKQTLAVARDIIRAGEVVLRDLTAADFNLPYWEVSLAPGTAENDYIVEFVIPDRKAYGIYGLVLESEPPEASIDYVDIYVGGSRVRRIPVHAVKDGADTGKTLYLSAEQAIILKEGAKVTVKVRATNSGSAAVKAKLAFLGFVAEPLNETITKTR
jgi:hypothetical protein